VPASARAALSRFDEKAAHYESRVAQEAAPPVAGEAAYRLGEGRESIGEVGSAAVPDVQLLEPLAGENPKPVMLHLVQPAGSSGRSTDVGSHGRMKPTGGFRRQLDAGARQAHQRYAHAKQFKRANRALKTIRTYLGGVIRDIVRKIKGEAELESAFAHPLMLARRVRQQRQHQRGKKVYSLHAPEVECIGKGKAHRPYEFGVKVSIATTLNRSRGGQFIAHAKALPGNPYDGHTLATVIPEIETQIGANLTRIVADRGYRGHNAPPDQKFKVYISGQSRRVTETIKRELRRRSAVEPVIGHSKAEHRMGRNYLAGTNGDAANAVLAAAGYNFRRPLEWLALLLSAILAALSAAASHDAPLKPA
jgi:hypothetical protein